MRVADLIGADDALIRRRGGRGRRSLVGRRRFRLDGRRGFGRCRGLGIGDRGGLLLEDL
jgi:hypothetical protein